MVILINEGSRGGPGTTGHDQEVLKNVGIKTSHLSRARGHPCWSTNAQALALTSLWQHRPNSININFLVSNFLVCDLLIVISVVQQKKKRKTKFSSQVILKNFLQIALCFALQFHLEWSAWWLEWGTTWKWFLCTQLSDKGKIFSMTWRNKKNWRPLFTLVLKSVQNVINNNEVQM